MNLRTALISALTIAAAAMAPAWARPASILQLDSSLDTPAVVPPASFDTDVHAMMSNWYLRNYARLDSMADMRKPVETTDQVIIDRLHRLPTVIEMPFNREVRAFIDMYTLRKRSLVEAILGMSNYYMPIFEEALEAEKMPNELKYLAVIESALNPNAVSKAGAAGLWQFMAPTAKGLGLEINSLVDERRDPVKSSRMAARYLKQLHSIYDDWSLAIAAYNCGPGNVNKAIRRAGGNKPDFWEIYPYLPAETRGYVPCFIAAAYVMNYHNDHNIAPALTRHPIVTDSVHVGKRVHFQQIADVLNIPIDEIRILNPQYRADFIPGDVRPYPLVLPSRQIVGYIISEDSIVAHDAQLYAHRAVVNPADGTKVNVSADGDYIVTEKVRWHKVGRGETLTSIANRYGITVAQLKRSNGNIRRVKRGQSLKIVTTQRTPRPVEEAEKSPAEPLAADSLGVEAPADSLAVPAGEIAQEVAPAMVQEPEPTPKAAAQPVSKKQKDNGGKGKTKAKTEPQPQARTVVVRKGDNLSKIARREGTTVENLRKLNGLSGSDIKAGQKLKVK